MVGHARRPSVPPSAAVAERCCAGGRKGCPASAWSLPAAAGRLE